jgi:D-glycero-alpha-D-manno-heptose 1-phosphate guanylyltransferase
VDSQPIRQAIILAGGFGTRLQAVLRDVPKPLAPVRGFPFIHYVLRWLEASGIERVIGCTGYLADKMEAGFRTYRGALEMKFLREDSPLGTGGAIYRALGEVERGGVFVLNGDTYFPADLTEFQREAERLGGPFAIALRCVPDVSRFGAVQLEGGRIVAMNEKGLRGPGLVNAGLYLLPHDLWQALPMPVVFSWEVDLMEPKAPLLGTAGVVLSATFLDIGTPESYGEAESVLPRLPGDAEAGSLHPVEDASMSEGEFKDV